MANNYLGLDILGRHDINVAKERYKCIDPLDFESWTESRVKTFEYNQQTFESFVDIPDNVDANEVVLFCSEFATGLNHIRLIEKALIARDAINPRAFLVIQPNSTKTRPYMNFSEAERNELRSGNAEPIVGRINTIMANIGSPNKITVFGPSQGATVVLEYASQLNQSVTVIAVEAPNVISRSDLRLAIDFLSAGKDLPLVVESNFENDESDYADIIRNDASLPGMINFGREALNPDNFALMGLMKQNTAADLMEKVLKNGGRVLHAWAENENVSPDPINLAIAEDLRQYPKYKSEIFKKIGHAVTDNNILIKSLAEESINI